jgi:hypothetical protein
VVLGGVSVNAWRSHRLAAGVEQLEAVYREIASRGEPFPESIDRAAYETPAYLQWYYQKNGDKAFAIVYIVSSDGWAMEYPGGEWRHVGCRPDGYGPKPAGR